MSGAKDSVGYLRRMKLAGLSYPLPAELQTDDAALEARLYPPLGPREPSRSSPNWPRFTASSAGKTSPSTGSSRSTARNIWMALATAGFYKAYQECAQRLPVTLRQVHVPGQKLFVDYSGKKIGIIDAHTGEIRKVELFVTALGMSNANSILM